ncbi:histidine phosphatase family protein [Methyloterricola oryzae]|uniref:histidine phosphatase family protein n=1 Tax=Methyloterricola oryzae TaxID=1495050 RepID=UPI0005EB0A71|nr:alpha-ribazole phosphatase family protein [Methyloterricola oryzae]
MSATRIQLLRHGDVTGGPKLRGSQDDPLTDLGWRQMRAAVAGIQCDRVVASPLRRCAEFARELAEGSGVPLRQDARLQELHFGEWEGRRYAELTAEDPIAVSRFFADPFQYPPPGGESLQVFCDRVLAAFADLCGGEFGQRPLVVTHGGVIRVLLWHLRDWPPQRLLEIEVPHASLHELRPGADGQWREDAEARERHGAFG